MLLLLLASHSDLLDLVFPSKSNVASCRTYGLPSPHRDHGHVKKLLVWPSVCTDKSENAGKTSWLAQVSSLVPGHPRADFAVRATQRRPFSRSVKNATELPALGSKSSKAPRTGWGTPKAPFIGSPQSRLKLHAFSIQLPETHAQVACGVPVCPLA